MENITLSSNFEKRAKNLENHFIDRVSFIINGEFQNTNNYFLSEKNKVCTFDRQFIQKKDETTEFKEYKRTILFKQDDASGIFSHRAEEVDINNVKFCSIQEGFDIENDQVVCKNKMQIKISDIDKLFKDSLKESIFKDFEGLLALAENYLNTKIEYKKIDFKSIEDSIDGKKIIDVLSFNIKVKSLSKNKKFNIFVNKKVINQKGYWRTIAYFLFDDVFNIFDKEEFCNLEFDKIKEQMALISY